MRAIPTPALLALARAVVALDAVLDALEVLGIDYDNDAIALVIRATRVEIADCYQMETTASDQIAIAARLHAEADAILALPPFAPQGTPADA